MDNDRRSMSMKIARHIQSFLLTACVFACGLFSHAAADSFGDLKKGAKIADFTLQALYDNDASVPIGGRFVHTPSGFVLDLLRIQSVPQAFVWVNTPPVTDQGEPHTLEHLLLGKGTKGRFVASLEDMSLGESSAYTEQLRTCYHYHTSAGNDVFFRLYEAKLDAMLSPNFSDEEIRREVCNVGLTVDRATGEPALEEKGTVYNEMVSSYERWWGNLYLKLGRLMYGEAHPLSYSAGGFPDDIRTMTPQDIRTFHATTHQLTNMGSSVSIPDDITIVDALTRFSQILKRVSPDAKKGADPATAYYRLPPTKPAPTGTLAVESFPSSNPSDPGVTIYAWPAQFDLPNDELLLLLLFMYNFANDETTNLYRLFVNSSTRTLDIGASGTYAYMDITPGFPFYVGLDNVRPDYITEVMLDSIRTLILGELSAIAAYPAGSEELTAFNTRLKNRITEYGRSQRKFVNTPPGWGARSEGTGSAWIDRMLMLNRRPEQFRRSLTLSPELRYCDSVVSAPGNPWTALIARWKLTSVKPYGVGTKPNAESIARSESERTQRMAAFTEKLKADYAVATDKEAIAQYKLTYDVNTAVIDSAASTIKLPGFLDNPPLTIDPTLKVTVDSFASGGQLVLSTFDNITSGAFGLAFNLNVIPESLLVYAAALPSFVAEVGVERDGRFLTYEAQLESLRKDILGLDAYFSVRYRNGADHAELVVKATGSNAAENRKALDWLESVLMHSDLRPENLSRVRDMIDVGLSQIRSRTKGPEEYWVNTPAFAYWRQHNPLVLVSECFYTQAHALQRLRWQFRDVQTDAQLKAFQNGLAAIGSLGTTLKREELSAALALVDGTAPIPAGHPLAASLTGMDSLTRGLLRQAAEDLTANLSDLPDVTLASDWNYLCKQIAADLAVSPLDALERVKTVLGLIRRQDNVRGFVIASSAEQQAALPTLEKIVASLDGTPSQQASYAPTARVTERMAQHSPNAETATFVGLVHNGTRSGVHINNANCASFFETDQERLIDFLSARLYGGGGAHSMFMQTWGAGLAYSNGLRSNETTGRLNYYAERCPELAQTMDFVVGVLRKAPYDSALASYAVSQAFAFMRSGGSYETRGEAMAQDIADGMTDQAVSGFRKGIMQLHKQPGLYDKLHARMEAVYGRVLPGYGPSAVESKAKWDAVNFAIGPDKQLDGWQAYLQQTESPDTKLHKLYPRDFWITLAN